MTKSAKIFIEHYKYMFFQDEKIEFFGDPKDKTIIEDCEIDLPESFDKDIFTHIKNYIFKNVHFKNCNFKYVCMVNVSFYNCVFINCNLSYGHLYSDTDEANFHNNTLINTNIKELKFDTKGIVDKIFFDEKTIGVENICPQTESFFAYKKVTDPICKNRKLIAKLFIPASARRSNATSNTCRTDRAVLVNIYDLKGNEIKNLNTVKSMYYNFYYIKNKMVYIEDFNPNRWFDFTTGIHFFMTFEEAVNY